ncbi:hypothetical protein M9H77_11967 [Catharanthus roseus]|uniref:Uncharacterized protein n=1 Tax=Catharanthus roseus TaxID=4058 RepID=A0ACC0BG97_CATRO|nr:hypothetical protein M9H77_11967 [Catharanthus roseus]
MGEIKKFFGFDYQGVENLQIKSENWHSIAVILHVYAYNYLHSQCTYDVAPGGLLASVYYLTRIEYGYLSQGGTLGFRLSYGFGKVWILKNENPMICWESLMIIIQA